MSLLEVQDLRVSFRTDDGIVPALRGVDFALERGRTLAIVGESGCGKSAACLAVTGLHAQRTTEVSGRALWKGRDLLALPPRELRRIRGDEVAMVFQDPMSSLNPVQTIGKQIAEAVLIHRDVTRRAARARALELLDEVGIPEPERRFGDYPHRFSGGMRQRVGIAIALANDPDLLIADEPTTALDVTTQAQILTLLLRLRRDRGMAILLVTHDLGVVAEVADDVLVMYAGEVVERAPLRDLFRAPRHPYTRHLLASLPGTAAA